MTSPYTRLGALLQDAKACAMQLEGDSEILDAVQLAIDMHRTYYMPTEEERLERAKEAAAEWAFEDRRDERRLG